MLRGGKSGPAIVLGKSDKSATGFGYVETPLKVGNRRSGLLPEQMLPHTHLPAAHDPAPAAPATRDWSSVQYSARAACVASRSKSSWSRTGCRRRRPRPASSRP